MAAYYWDQVHRNFKESPEKRSELVKGGLEAINRALVLNPDYLDATVYKGLLLRMQAGFETDPVRQKTLMDEAQQLQVRAKELQTNQLTSGQQAGGVNQPPGAPIRVGGNIGRPPKSSTCPLSHPAEAHAARVQGVVILEIMVDGNGSVAEARVVRSIPLLDEAAVTAVRQWQYTPTMLNGQPVPVIPDVTVISRWHMPRAVGSQHHRARCGLAGSRVVDPRSQRVVRLRAQAPINEHAVAEQQRRGI